MEQPTPPPLAPVVKVKDPPPAYTAWLAPIVAWPVVIILGILLNVTLKEEGSEWSPRVLGMVKGSLNLLVFLVIHGYGFWVAIKVFKTNKGHAIAGLIVGTASLLLLIYSVIVMFEALARLAAQQGAS